MSDSPPAQPCPLSYISITLTTQAPLHHPPSTGHRLAALLLLPKDTPVGAKQGASKIIIISSSSAGEMTDAPSTPPPVSSAPVGGDPADTLIDKEQVLASFAGIEWDKYGRTMLDAEEVSRGREGGREGGGADDNSDQDGDGERSGLHAKFYCVERSMRVVRQARRLHPRTFVL